jgi:phage shock protein PspC (stress-responsive transcriptional regulator)
MTDDKTEPAAPQSPPPARRLTRRPEGKILGGVCTGIAAFTGTDPVLVRVGFVLAAILGGGTGVLIYLVMWLVMPMAHEGDPYPPPPTGTWFDSSSAGRWIGIGAIVLGALFIFRNVWHFHAGIFWGLILLGVGVALWSREMTARNGNGHTPATPRPLAPPTPPAPGIAGGSPPVQPPRTLEATSPAPAPSPVVRTPSVLGRLVVGAAALAVGIAFLLDNAHLMHVTPRGVTAVLLGIVGVGLIVGSWSGRARWLIFPGLGLALVLSGMSFAPTGFNGRWGDAEWTPKTWDEVPAVYEHGGGNATLDLRGLEFGKEPRTINVRTGFGNLEVVLPPDVPVVVNARVQAGNLEVLGSENNGWQQRTTITDDPGKPGIGRLTLNLRAGFGNIEVRRAAIGEAVISSSGHGHVKVQIGPGGVNVDAGDESTPAPVGTPAPPSTPAPAATARSS